MFKNKASNGKNNISGENIKSIRKEAGISQRELADRLQIAGLDIGKNGVQKIEAGEGFVTDIELVFFADVLGVTVQDLLK